ncbi:MAG TPA: chemoreceptor glutamine deamidase CheD [Ramlibacter sp.]|nr:chemoreceptor glutamine deamidase CheD [Ramlibacter sp.]
MHHGIPIRYFDRDFKLEAVKILPGQYHAAAGAVGMSTVLGSCVSTCLWDPARRIGGMNHFMLPGDNGTAGSPVTKSARFGVYAMELLINDMLKLGAERRRLVAKVFGGGRLLRGFGALDVGGRNCTFVLDFLKTEGIPVLAQDLLDNYPRKVHFSPENGKVLLKKLDRMRDDTVQRQELEYLRSLGSDPGAGAIEIFARPK